MPPVAAGFMPQERLNTAGGTLNAEGKRVSAESRTGLRKDIGACASRFQIPSINPGLFYHEQFGVGPAFSCPDLYESFH